MAKFLNREASGRVAQLNTVQTSAGVADADKIPSLDSQGKLDQSMMPAGLGQNTVSGTAAGALAANDLVYITSSGTVSKASAAAVGTEAIGFVKTSVANGAVATVFTSGNLITGLSGLTPGARQYMSATAGLITATPLTTAGNVHMCIGIATSATAVAFEPEEPITLA